MHLQAAYRIFHYLKDTSIKGIMFKRNNRLLVEAYMDTNYTSSLAEKNLHLDIVPFLEETKWLGEIKSKI